MCIRDRDRVTALIEDAQKESVVQFSLADGAKSVARELSLSLIHI